MSSMTNDSLYIREFLEAAAVACMALVACCALVAASAIAIMLVTSVIDIITSS